MFEWLKPAWQSSSPNKRLHAVQRLKPSQQEVILRLAQDDADENIRAAAIAKVDDLQALTKLLVDPRQRQEKIQRLIAIAAPGDIIAAAQRFSSAPDTAAAL